MTMKIIVIYASLTGNTEEMAELIADGIRQTGANADVKCVDDCNAVQLLSYDGYVLGAYTWGDGELPDEFLDFTEEMDEVNLNGSRAAVFGSGDTTYSKYCGAVDVLENKLQECHVTIVQQSLKVEFGPNKEEQDACRVFGKNFANVCNSFS